MVAGAVSLPRRVAPGHPRFRSGIPVGWPGGGDSMRDDMSKVVTERPRQGHGNKSKKTTGPRIRRYDPDREHDEPTRLPIACHRQYGYDAKEFSDLINPLKRYLRTVPASVITSTLTKLARLDPVTFARF